jgi:predicted ArsR family transcriptional regulator
MALDLEEIDERILDVLSEGRNSPKNIADRLDVSRQYVHKRLKLLRAADHVETIGGGIYELVDDPRDDQDDADRDLEARLAELQAELGDVRAERDRLQERVDELEAQADDDLDRDAIRRAADTLEAACERGDGAGVQDALDHLREAIDDA